MPRAFSLIKYARFDGKNNQTKLKNQQKKKEKREKNEKTGEKL